MTYTLVIESIARVQVLAEILALSSIIVIQSSKKSKMCYLILCQFIYVLLLLNVLIICSSDKNCNNTSINYTLSAFKVSIVC